MTACIFTFGNLILFSLQNVGRKVVFSLTFSIHFENVGSFNHFFSKYFRFTVLRVCYRVLFFTALIDFIEIVPFFVKKMQICSKMYSGSALFVLYRPLPINFRASNMPNYIILHFQSNIYLSNHRHYNTFCSLNFIYTNSAKKHFRSIHTKIKAMGWIIFSFYINLDVHENTDKTNSQPLFQCLSTSCPRQKGFWTNSSLQKTLDFKKESN